MVMENEQEMNREVEEPENAIADPGREKETLIREIESGKASVAEMKEALAAGDAEIAALQRSMDGEKEHSAALANTLAGAVAAYRELVVKANPGVLEEMVTGDSIEKVNASLQGARALAEKVRRELEAEASRTRVPAGAPPRLAPDLSALSAREKIQLALGGQ